MADSPTILVVDDTPAILKLVKDLLTAEGFTVLTANSGALALRALATHRPTLILLDIRMPEMDGFEVCRRLKGQEASRDIPVIFISAATDVEERVEGFALGAVDFISKPFQRDELLARMRTHLELRLLQTSLEQQVRERTAALEKSSRAYRALSLCNHLVAHASDESRLLREACEIVRDAFGYHMVWIGLAEQDAARTVRAVALAGLAAEYLAHIRISWGEDEHGREPAGTAIRTRQPSIHRHVPNNPWPEPAAQYGCKSSAAFPMLNGERCLGALVVYSGQVDAFAEEEARLLEELAANLAYGMRLLRVQAERRRSEELLRASEEKYRALIESTTDWIWEMDAGGRYVYSSPKVAEILGYAPEDILGKSCLELMPEDEAERLGPHVAAAFAARTPIHDLESRVLHRNGGEVRLENNGVPAFDDEGNFTGYRGIGRDVTARKQAEQALLKRTAELDNFFSVALDLLCIINDQGRFLRLNPAWENTLGFTLDEIMAKPFMDLVHPEDVAGTRETGARLIAQGRMSNFINRYRCKNGTYRWLEWRAAYLGGLIFGAARDITERMRLETELQGLNNSLIQRVKEEVAKNREKDHVLIHQSRLAAMGEMVHNIAHQWRQPLSALAIIIRNIKDDYDFGELTAESLYRAVTKSQSLLLQMSTTIDGFRNFFRPDLEPCDFDLAAAVEDSLFVMEAALANSRIELVKRLPPGMKACGFLNQFSQAVLNIIANAKEVIQLRNPEGGRIEISLTRSETRAILTIQDNGGGIPEEVLPKIFDPYFTTKEQGSGIGLYMTKMIIERNLQGTITARNHQNGALFTISIPLLKDGEDCKLSQANSILADSLGERH